MCQTNIRLTRAVLNVSLKHIFVNQTSFVGIPKSIRTIKIDAPPNIIAGFFEVREHLTHCRILFPFFLKYLAKTECMILSYQWHVEMHTDDPQQFLLPTELNLTAYIG